MRQGLSRRSTRITGRWTLGSPIGEGQLSISLLGQADRHALWWPELQSWLRWHGRQCAWTMALRMATSIAEEFVKTDPVTREQMATFLATALNLPPAPHDWFREISGPHYENIKSLAQADNSQGCSPDGSLFGPTDPVTRADGDLPQACSGPNRALRKCEGPREGGGAEATHS